MPVQITINGENAAQAIEEFATLSAAFSGAVAPAAPAKEDSKSRQRKASEPRKEQLKEDPAPEDQEDVGANSTGDDEKVEIPSVVDLRAKAAEIGTKGAEAKKAIKALLNKFESKSISDVPEEKRIAFMAELEAL